MAATLISQLIDGLKKIDQSCLPGKFKVWCYQFTLYKPLKLCDITSTTVLKMDKKANSYIRKWLGLPRGLSNVALFRRNILELPLKFISLGYKQEKVRLLFKLRDSPDPLVRNTEAQIPKWSVTQTVEKAINWLKHLEIAGFSQPGRIGLGMWSKASTKGKERPGDH